MEPKTGSILNTQIYEEACEWFVEFRSGDLDSSAQREFDLWVRRSPEHLAAYFEIAAIWNEGSFVDSMREWDTDTLISQAAADSAIIVPFQPQSQIGPKASA